MITEFIVTSGESRKRLDVFLLHREPGVTRSQLQRLIEHGRVRINDQIVKSSQKIKPGDCISMDTPQPGTLAVNGKIIPLDILHEDDAIMVVNKPAGVVVHPTSGHWSGTLMNALLSHFQVPDKTLVSKQEMCLPRLVHRLDKDTSGVMVIAKSDRAHRALAVQFEQHTITRTYEALVFGVPRNHHGEIKLAIGRDKQEPKTVSSNTKVSKGSTTEYLVRHSFGTLASHVWLHPRTGRTHQLRVHMKCLGSPILGDETYGGWKVCVVNDMAIPRVMLHARLLGFQHPTSGTYEEFMVEPPADMREVSQALPRESQR
jgi:23S rRNA pseudouridine1911/1915/1917 synthase